MEQNDLDRAQQLWQESLRYFDPSFADSHIASCRYLAICLYRKGQLTEAQRMFEQALSDAETYSEQRAIVSCLLRLAEIDLDQGKVESAERRLAASSRKALEYQDRRYIAQIQRAYARLHTLRSDLRAARLALTEAIDLFERLGMRRELAEARAALADLDARE
jgi:LuxR family glucitol operon transcriptional activator